MKENILGLSIARWSKYSAGSITDSLTYLNDNGDLASPSINTLENRLISGDNLENTKFVSLKADPSLTASYSIQLPDNSDVDLTGKFLKVESVAPGPIDTLRLSWAVGDGTGTVTSITAGTGLTGGTITTAGTISLANTAVTAGTYNYASISVDAQGRIIEASKSYIEDEFASTVGKGFLNGVEGVVINTTAVSTSSIITITRNVGIDTPPSVITIGNLIVGSIVDHESFTVYSTTISDLSGFNWFIINP
jgi:hypothetical protein